MDNYTKIFLLDCYGPLEDSSVPLFLAFVGAGLALFEAEQTFFEAEWAFLEGNGTYSELVLWALSGVKMDILEETVLLSCFLFALFSLQLITVRSFFI